MQWIPLKEAIEKHPLSSATIRRRIAALIKLDPILYVKIIRQVRNGSHRLHECLEKEFFAFLNTDIRVFKRASLAAHEKKEDKTMDDPDPSAMRMLVELLRVNDLHEIDPEFKDTIKMVLHSQDSLRWQKGVKICYHYSFADESLEMVCKKVGVTRKTFIGWSRNLPLLSYLFANSQLMRHELTKLERGDRAVQSLNKLVAGYDKILQTRKYKVKMLPDGTEVLIAYEVQEQAKHVVPNIHAISLELYNHKPEEYKRFTPFDEINRAHKPIDDLANKSLEELDEEIEQLETKLLEHGNNGAESTKDTAA